MDKPVGVNFAEVMAIYTLAEALQVPVFSSSSLRWLPGIKSCIQSTQCGERQQQAKNADAPLIVGANVTSPCPFETQCNPKPDLYFCE